MAKLLPRSGRCDLPSFSGRSAAYATSLHGGRGRPLATQALFGGLIGGKTKRVEKKAELLSTVSTLKRGLTASQEEKDEVESLVQQLERLNPTKKPLASPLINGKWELMYTTSDSILGTKKPPFLRPQGPIYQLIDAVNLKAANRESWPLFNSVTAALTPQSDSQVGVQFKQFKILGLIPITAPDSARGTLNTTYLDEELRISRGDKGNLFILTMADPDERP